MGKDQKKHDKLKKREQKVQKERLYSQRIEAERRRRDQYPKIIIDPSNGNPEFVALVRESVAGMDFDDRTMFHPVDRTFYNLLREYGFDYALRCLRIAMAEELADGVESARIGETAILMGFGIRMLDRIPEELRRRYMPFNDVLVKFERHDIIIMFTSLLAERGERGTIFYSDLNPQIEFHDKKWTIGFSRHAIERICERNNPRFANYGASGDAYALFANCVYYEPVTLFQSQPAFAIWDSCFDPTFTRYDTYVRQILGEDNVDPFGGKTYFRVGYCPVVFDGEFAKAKTFLYPGYTTTPEYGLVLKTPLARSEKDLLLKQATTHDSTEVLLNDNPTAIKWFHVHGIPQVIQMKDEVFVHYSDKRRR